MNNRPSTTEKLWTTKAGLVAACVLTRGRHRCGYVGLPNSHPLYGADWNDKSPYLKQLSEDEPAGKRSPITLLLMNASSMEQPTLAEAFDVHGGLTFAGHWRSEKDTPELSEGNLWWIGFDCAHLGDGKITYEGDPDYMLNYGGDEVRTLEYVMQECENLAAQVLTRCVSQVKLIVEEAGDTNESAS